MKKRSSSPMVVPSSSKQRDSERKAFIPDLDRKLGNFGVPPKFFGEMRALVEYGTRPSKELLTRLNHVKNYKTCLDSLLAELSRPFIQQHFPPPVDHFESIEVTA